jgi:hypothetical protein
MSYHLATYFDFLKPATPGPTNRKILFVIGKLLFTNIGCLRQYGIYINWLHYCVRSYMLGQRWSSELKIKDVMMYCQIMAIVHLRRLC